MVHPKSSEWHSFINLNSQKLGTFDLPISPHLVSPKTQRDGFINGHSQPPRPRPSRFCLLGLGLCRPHTDHAWGVSSRRDEHGVLHGWQQLGSWSLGGRNGTARTGGKSESGEGMPSYRRFYTFLSCEDGGTLSSVTGLAVLFSSFFQTFDFKSLLKIQSHNSTKHLTILFLLSIFCINLVHFFSLFLFCSFVKTKPFSWFELRPWGWLHHLPGPPGQPPHRRLKGLRKGAAGAPGRGERPVLVQGEDQRTSGDLEESQVKHEKKPEVLEDFGISLDWFRLWLYWLGC